MNSEYQTPPPSRPSDMCKLCAHKPDNLGALIKLYKDSSSSQ